MAGFDGKSMTLPLIQAILIFMCILNFVLSLVEHEKPFTSWPARSDSRLHLYYRLL